MNLSDIDTNSLGKIESRYKGCLFGDNKQVIVVDCLSYNRRQKSSQFLVWCSECSNDSELFGEGYFKCVLSTLLEGGLPCGCSKNHKWSEQEYKVLLKRKSFEKGFDFLGWEGDFIGSKTLLKMSCPYHGFWNSGRLYHLLNNNRGCPKCKGEGCSKRQLIAEDIYIQKFRETLGYHPETTFWRNNENTDYWFIDCPDCGEVAETHKQSLLFGYRPCACSQMRQTFSYILGIYNEEQCVAIKFGITNSSSKRRLNNINCKSIYSIRMIDRWKYPNYKDCKSAETHCLRNLACGVISKQDMLDGWSETTWVYNIEKVIQIFESYGGVRFDR